MGGDGATTAETTMKIFYLIGGSESLERKFLLLLSKKSKMMVRGVTTTA
jgi:hypothetical protein